MATCNSIDFFAEYLIASYLADGTQMARPLDKHENTLEHLEYMIAENGEAEYKESINQLWAWNES